MTTKSLNVSRPNGKSGGYEYDIDTFLNAGSFNFAEDSTYVGVPISPLLQKTAASLTNTLTYDSVKNKYLIQIMHFVVGAVCLRTYNFTKQTFTTWAIIKSGGGTGGAVETVNGISPDGLGNVQLTAKDLDTLTSTEIAALIQKAIPKVGTTLIKELKAGNNVTITEDKDNPGVFTINATGGSGTGDVKSVCNKAPDEAGNVDLVASDVDTYTRAEIDAKIGNTGASRIVNCMALIGNGATNTLTTFTDKQGTNISIPACAITSGLSVMFGNVAAGLKNNQKISGSVTLLVINKGDTDEVVTSARATILGIRTDGSFANLTFKDLTNILIKSKESVVMQFDISEITSNNEYPVIAAELSGFTGVNAKQLIIHGDAVFNYTIKD